MRTLPSGIPSHSAISWPSFGLPGPRKQLDFGLFSHALVDPPPRPPFSAASVADAPAGRSA